MTKEYRAKIFKSGNSLALRLPKALGFEEGAEMILREEQSRLTVEPAVPPKRKINIRDFIGSVPGIKREPFEQKPRVWDK